MGALASWFFGVCFCKHIVRLSYKVLLALSTHISLPDECVKTTCTIQMSAWTIFSAGDIYLNPLSYIATLRPYMLPNFFSSIFGL